MSKFQGKRITSATLETTPGLVVFRKVAGKTKFKLSAVDTSGAEVALDAVDSDELTLTLGNYEPKITAGTSAQYWRGDKTWQTLNKAAVGLANVDNTSDLNKPISTATQTALNLKANDADVVKLTGNQTIAGTKTFSSPVVVATPTGNTHATTKLYVDTADAALQLQINALQSSLKPPLDIDCSTNPNYPSGNPGDNWIVTVAGKIGGAAGPDVEVGDWIICKAISAGGTQASVGSNYFIVQTNTGIATESTPGLSRLATLAEAEGKTNNVGVMTTLKTVATIAKTAVRFDVAQSLTTGEKTQARTNIGALGSADLDGYITNTPSGTWTSGFTSGKAMVIGSSTGAPGAGVVYGISVVTTDSQYGGQIAFRNNVANFRTKENGTDGAWLTLADRDWTNTQITNANAWVTEAW